MRVGKLMKLRPDQLILADDPAFFVDQFLEPPPIEFDDILQGDSINSSQPILSIRGRSSSYMLEHKNSPPGLDLSSSTHGSIGSYHLPTHDPFGGTSPITRSVDLAKININDEQMLLQNDDLFEIDDNGEIHELPGTGQNLSDLRNIYPKVYPESEFATSGRVYQGHEDATQNHQDVNVNLKRNSDLRWGESEKVMINDNPNAFEATNSNKRLTSHPVDGALLPSHEAFQKNKKAKTKKHINITDNLTEMRSVDVKKMTAEYYENMESQFLIKNRGKINLACKKNAFHFVFGAGINRIGYDWHENPNACPLSSFLGETLRAKILGPQAEVYSNGKKRVRPTVESYENIPVNKRARNFDLDFAPQHSPNEYYEDILPIHSHGENGESDVNDKSMEIGREVASALSDHPASSSLMPWNTTTSGQFSRPQSSIRQRHGSHLTSVSPLIGRASTLPKDLNDVSFDDQDDMIIYDRSGVEVVRVVNERQDEIYASLGTGFNSPPIHSSQKTSRHVSISRGAEYDLLGPSAATNTQKARTSQWIPEALDRESYNFLEFLQGEMTEKKQESDNQASRSHGRISFNNLLPPEKNTCNIAAQAFYHVLSLANKNIIHVQQRGIHDGFIDHDIHISIA